MISGPHTEQMNDFFAARVEGTKQWKYCFTHTREQHKFTELDRHALASQAGKHAKCVGSDAGAKVDADALLDLQSIACQHIVSTHITNIYFDNLQLVYI